MKKNIYLAGPLFHKGDTYYVEKINAKLIEWGFTTYVPHLDGGIYSADMQSTLPFFQSDITALDSCDLIVAILNGQDVDSGTAWEMGYGFAKGKAVFAIAEDSRIAGNMKNINLMLTNSSKVSFTVEELKLELEKYKQ